MFTVTFVNEKHYRTLDATITSTDEDAAIDEWFADNTHAEEVERSDFGTWFIANEWGALNYYEVEEADEEDED